MYCIQNTANADFAIFYKHVTSEKEAEFLPLSDCLPKFFASIIFCLSLFQGAPNNVLLDSELGGDVLQMSCIQNTANADFAIFYKHVTSEKEAEFLPLSDCLPKFFASLIICLSLLQGSPNNALLDSKLGGDVLQMSCIQNTANADFAIFYKHVTSEKEAEFLPLSDCLPKFFASLIICLSLLQKAPNNALLDSELGGDVLQMSCIQNTANADFAIFYKHVTSKRRQNSLHFPTA